MYVKKKQIAQIKVYETYPLVVDNIPCVVKIHKDPEKFIPTYELLFPKVDVATSLILDSIKQKLVQKIRIKISEILDPKSMETIKQKFLEEALDKVSDEFPVLQKSQQISLASMLVHDMLGLGKLELLIDDPTLEEIVVNNSSTNIWVYHKKHGWLETNIRIPSEEQIFNYSSIIGRKVGRQLTNLTPLMDAHLLTGDRVNATLFPISTAGNTLTIRKFARDPWTITHMISPEINTLSEEVASLLWLCMEYELNMIVAGGTASGKTSLLNALMPFIPSNHRIITIEDTRELLLPQYLHWVPLTTREPNPEGKGKVSMLDLMINSLRMRPDRIVLGEIRRRAAAEVLFEAMHTGHSVYSTLHADTVDQVKGRLINPPIEIPEEMLDALHLVIVQYRQRRLKIRRTFEVAEVIPRTDKTGKTRVDMGVLYRWDPKTDLLKKSKPSVRLFDQIQLHTGLSDKELHKDLLDKQHILDWMLKNNINTVNSVGKVVAEYYNDNANVVDIVSKNKSPSSILGEEIFKELKKK